MSFSFRYVGKTTNVLADLLKANVYGGPQEQRVRLMVAAELASYKPGQGVLVECSGHEYTDPDGLKHGNLSMKVEAVLLSDDPAPEKTYMGEKTDGCSPGAVNMVSQTPADRSR